MIHTIKLQKILETNECLTITFVGSPELRRREAILYTYSGKFVLQDNRLICPNIDYTRSISKIIMICKNDDLLYGKR